MPFTEARGTNVNSDLPDDVGVQLPWAGDKSASYVYYECAVGSMLDSGIVVHNRLPQVDRGYDTLASAQLDDPNLDQISGFGVNLKCLDQYKDIVQRMGHARYWFRLWGQALRIGYQVPIPGIKYIGGVPAVPYDQNPQWAYNTIVPGGNFGGVILWRAQWSLWYTTATQPIDNKIPVSDPTAHIRAEAPLPVGIQAPISQPDDNYVTNLPSDLDTGLFIKGQGS
jgi:hypothetical protein